MANSINCSISASEQDRWLERLKQVWRKFPDDLENRHDEADRVLLDFIEDIGFDNLATLYREIT